MSHRYRAGQAFAAYALTLVGLLAAASIALRASARAVERSFAGVQ